MTKEEKIILLKGMIELMDESTGYTLDDKYYNADDCKSALDLAIKALEQQTSDDCVSREQLIAKLKAWDNKVNAIPLYAWKVIKDMPHVTPKVHISNDCR